MFSISLDLFNFLAVMYLYVPGTSLPALVTYLGVRVCLSTGSVTAHWAVGFNVQVEERCSYSLMLQVTLTVPCSAVSDRSVALSPALKTFL